MQNRQITPDIIIVIIIQEGKTRHRPVGGGDGQHEGSANPPRRGASGFRRIGQGSGRHVRQVGRVLVKTQVCRNGGKRQSAVAADGKIEGGKQEGQESN